MTTDTRDAIAPRILIDDWSQLRPGDFVAIELNGAVEQTGWFDEATADGNMLWIHLVNAGGRRMFLREDGFRVSATGFMVSAPGPVGSGQRILLPVIGKE